MIHKLKVLEKMLHDLSEYHGAKSVSKILNNIKYASLGGRITIPGDTHSTYEYIPFSEYSGEGGYFEVITSEAPQDVGMKFYPNEIQFNRILTKGMGQGVSLARRDVVRTGFKTRPPQINNDIIVGEPEPSESTDSTSEPQILGTTIAETGSVETFIMGVLQGIGAPVTDDNVEFLSTWISIEGSRAQNNPFNLTMRLPGSTPLDPNNRNGVQNYPTQEIGIQAMVKTMVLARNYVLVSALKSGKTATDIASIPQVQQAVSGINGNNNGQELYSKISQTHGINPETSPDATSSTLNAGQARRAGTPENDTQIFTEILKGLGAPVTEENLNFFRAWRAAEGGRALNNPFNTTLRRPGSTPYNRIQLESGSTISVQNFVDQQQGIEATIITLSNPRYKAIIDALKKNQPALITANDPDVKSALATWGTGAGRGGEDVYRVLHRTGGIPSDPVWSGNTARVSQQASGRVPSGLDSAGEDFLKRKEGKRLEAYPDPQGQDKNFSIGYGFSYFPNGFRGGRRRKVVRTDVITEAELEQLFDMVTSEFESAVTSSVTSSINQNQYNALVALAYNIGIDDFKASNLLRMVNENPNDPEIRAEFKNETKGYPPDSDTYKELLRRRGQEADLYFSR